MLNIQTKINKLLVALMGKGIIYKINTQQYYSEARKRLCTKMILWEEHPMRDGETFYSKVELLKYLIDKWKEVNEDGQSECESRTE